MLSSEEDIDYMSEAVLSGFDDVEDKSAALVLMGHGSPVKGEKEGYDPDHDPNKVYTDQEQSFRKLGYDNVFVGTVEAVPTLDDVINELNAVFPAPGRVYITPYLIVAGDHAMNDMAGDGRDSWKNRIAEEGYDVVTVLKGLGEHPRVRARFVEHAMEAEKL